MRKLEINIEEKEQKRIVEITGDTSPEMSLALSRGMAADLQLASCISLAVFLFCEENGIDLMEMRKQCSLS